MPRGGGHGASVACVVARAIIGPARAAGRRGACGPGPALKFKLLPRGLIALLQNRICRAVHLWCLGARLGYRGESPREGCCGSHAWVRLVDTGSSRDRVRGPDGMELVFNASKMKILEEIFLVRLLAMLLKEFTGKQLPNPLTQPVVDPFAKMIV